MTPFFDSECAAGARDGPRPHGSAPRRDESACDALVQRPRAPAAGRLLTPPVIRGARSGAATARAARRPRTRATTARPLRRLPRADDEVVEDPRGQPALQESPV